MEKTLKKKCLWQHIILQAFKWAFPSALTLKTTCKFWSSQKDSISPLLPGKGKWKVKALVTQSCPTLCNPQNCSPPGSSVLAILQAVILEWVAIPFPRGSFQPRGKLVQNDLGAWEGIQWCYPRISWYSGGMFLAGIIFCVPFFLPTAFHPGMAKTETHWKTNAQ